MNEPVSPQFVRLSPPSSKALWPRFGAGSGPDEMNNYFYVCSGHLFGAPLHRSPGAAPFFRSRILLLRIRPLTRPVSHSSTPAAGSYVPFQIRQLLNSRLLLPPLGYDWPPPLSARSFCSSKRAAAQANAGDYHSRVTILADLLCLSPRLLFSAPPLSYAGSSQFPWLASSSRLLRVLPSP